MGRKRGDEMNIVDSMARTLIKRGTAKPADSDSTFISGARDRMIKGAPKRK